MKSNNGKSKILCATSSWATGRKKGYYSGVDYFRLVLPAKAINKYSDKYVMETRSKLAKKNETGKMMYERLCKKEGFDGIIVKNVDTLKGISGVLWANSFFGLRLISDLDDNMNFIDEHNPVSLRYYPGSEAHSASNILIEKSTHVFVENNTLKDHYKQLNNKISVMPNCVDPDLVSKVRKNIKKFNDGKIRIGWAGGVTHAKDFETIVSELSVIMKKYDNVEFILFGGDDEFDTSMLPEGRHCRVKAISNYEDYPVMLAKMGIDIGIIPLADTRFNTNKSPCKWMEYSMAGIPAVMRINSHLPYARVYKEGNALGYKSSKQFIEQVERLINDKDLRAKIADTAYIDLMENYTIDKHWEKYEEIFDEIFEVS